MRRSIEGDQAERWEPWPPPKSSLTGGPVRVEDEPHPDHVPRPVGFTAQLEEPTTEGLLEQLRATYVDPPRRLCDPWPEGEPLPSREPLLWDGDQA